ncbi:MAG: UDP-N-acetylmuramate dehydrogenase [Colwellia sp.]|nr:UDP-N-acetylmuramate dehydrogenase [Colwellia sp.]
MESSQQFPLQMHNSFNVKAVCPTIYFLNNLSDLELLPDLNDCNFYILGDGTNTLFVDQNTPIIIKPDFKGIEIIEEEESYIVRVGAGENWHELVKTCLANGIYGLENLALIPGSVGAAPVQNIGAYGVEFADFCKQVKWFEFLTNTHKNLSSEACNFSYRNSIFKQSLYNKGVITEVEFKFPKVWRANLAYAGLNELAKNSTAEQVMNKVISLRQSKLPDPKVLANAGSFFKNPIIAQAEAEQLKLQYPSIPLYVQDDEQVKVAAGWLIEHAGLRGFQKNGVGVHKRQALVLVNYENDSGQEIIRLAKYVQQKVLAKYKILISPEVRMITEQGEQNFADLVIDKEYI